LPLAKTNKFVTAVELDQTLVEHGKKLILHEKLSTYLNFVECNCDDYCKNNALNETILLDPPRIGAKKAIESIAVSNVKKVVYVSCNVATLSRDLKILSNAGFDFRELYVLDMFPQTHHVETISHLQRTPGR
jgi:23S rRNA (uracil1939-C5)-methyltransferase